MPYPSRQIIRPGSQPDYCSPENGGCWFCHRNSGEMCFTWEWDANFHVSCLLQELAACDAQNAYNDEAEIIAREFNIPRPRRSCRYSCHNCNWLQKLLCPIRSFLYSLVQGEW